MPQVVTSENMVELIQTGKVAEFKPPEAKAAPATPSETKPGEPPASAQSRGADGKFTSVKEGDTTTPKPPKQPTASGEEEVEGGDDLSEAARKAIGKKHRQMKEAEEFARSEFRKRTEAEERAVRLQQQLDAQNPRSGPKPAETPQEPKPDDFKTVAEYTDALVTYRVDQREREREAKRQQEAVEQAEADRQREFAKRLSVTSEKYDDFQRVLASIQGTELEKVPKDVTEYIQESEQGGELLYHLAKNPDVLDRLRKLSPRRFIAELGKLEAKWEPTAEQPQKLTQIADTTAPPVSRAPAPIAPLESSGIAPVAKKPEEMSVAELREHRRQQDRQKRANGR